MAAPTAETTEDDGTRPLTLDGGPDDPKRIKGVGHRLEGVLHDIGICYFDQIAAWTPEEVAWADRNLVSFKGQASRDKRVRQARHLLDG